MIELLSPVGDFECLKAAVQNGADSVYFGANLFSARAFANNFDSENSLEEAINYAKLRGVKTNLTLNTLIKDEEFEDAFELAKKAYEFGIDAIIIQDLGLATKLLKTFPNITLHASTQMTVHNLDGVKKLENLGFKRVVLSRELSIEEIEYICKNSNIEIEVFVHGALCISYSGQCLFSSMVGGRSGNRGKCAQPCRLPYKLYENEKQIDKGYLLSSRDLCGLEHLPRLINSGVSCLKIEGRMKTPEYVATVTKIYRKYIDLILANKPFVIDPNDKKDLMQVFNRGGFSNGHLDLSPNQNLIFKEKPNNMGIYLGTVTKINPNKGLITCTLKNDIEIGDSITFEKENSKYAISELLDKNNNLKIATHNQTVTFGRMKGNINIGDKIYKIASKNLTQNALNSFSKEFRKTPLYCNILIKKASPISIEITSLIHNVSTNFVYDYQPLIAENKPLDKDTILKQFNKTNDTPFEFSDIKIDLDNNLFMPISTLNDLRRKSINAIEEVILNSFKNDTNTDFEPLPIACTHKVTNKQISVLLNELNLDFDYSNLKNIDKIYIPLKYFSNKNYSNIISTISNKFDTYIYMPSVIKDSYTSIIISNISNAIDIFNIRGFVISNLSQFDILNNFNDLEFIGNYTLNIFNNYTKNQLKKFGCYTITISPELNKASIDTLNNCNINTEIIVYGNIPLMTSNYCLLGKSNKCHKSCEQKCLKNNKYFIEDRLGLKFRIVPDNFQTITTIYNSKTTSIASYDFNVNSVRIDILDETIDQINNIVNTVISGNKLEGNQYTNGNLKREI